MIFISISNVIFNLIIFSVLAMRRKYLGDDLSLYEEAALAWIHDIKVIGVDFEPFLDSWGTDSMFLWARPHWINNISKCYQLESAPHFASYLGST